MKEECIFCKVVGGEIPAEVVYQDSQFLAIRDIHPAAPEHLLVLPKQHFATIAQCPEDPLLAALLRAVHHTAKAAGIAESGYRLVLNQGPDAGQEVPHLHFHVLGGKRLGWSPA